LTHTHYILEKTVPMVKEKIIKLE